MHTAETALPQPHRACTQLAREVPATMNLLLAAHTQSIVLDPAVADADRGRMSNLRLRTTQQRRGVLIALSWLA
eukprot:6491660-Amphidinium_carterae.1